MAFFLGYLVLKSAAFRFMKTPIVLSFVIAKPGSDI